MDDSGPNIGDVGEPGVLRALREVYAEAGEQLPAGWLGIGDDAAAIPSPAPGKRLLLTVDALVEGVHFERSWAPARFLGRKSLAVNLSDIAAMGGDATGALVALTLPSSLPLSFVTELVRGIAERGAAHGVPVIGGNLTGGEQLTITITALGECDEERVRTRGGAKAGDVLFVTGLLGSARAGLLDLKSSARAARLAESLARSPIGATVPAGTVVARDPRVSLAPSVDDELACILAQLDPTPRLEAGVFAVPFASAMIDVSDGLARDASQLAAASGLCAELELDQIPRRLRVSVENALAGGEDYELLCAVPLQRADELSRAGRQRGHNFHRVGTLSAVVGSPAGSVFTRNDDGRREPLATPGFQHFVEK